MSCKYLSKALNGNLRCKYKKQIIIFYFIHNIYKENKGEKVSGFLSVSDCFHDKKGIRRCPQDYFQRN